MTTRKNLRRRNNFRIKGKSTRGGTKGTTTRDEPKRHNHSTQKPTTQKPTTLYEHDKYLIRIKHADNLENAKYDEKLREKNWKSKKYLIIIATLRENNLLSLHEYRAFFSYVTSHVPSAYNEIKQIVENLKDSEIQKKLLKLI